MEVPVGGFRALAWFFEASNDVFLALHDGVIERANPAWRALAGLDPASEDPLTFWEWISPADRDGLRNRVHDLATGERCSAELRIRRRDRSEVWVRADLIGGDAGWVLAILRDVTIERRLRESEVRFRGLVNATSDVVYRMSPDWREMRQLDGRGFIADTESPSVKWIDEYLLPEDQPQILATIDEAVASQGVFQLEHRVRRVDGSVGWTFSRALPIHDENGEILEWFGAASDVTERRRAEEHLKLVVNELNHRVKNNLAMVQAATWQSIRHATDLTEAGESLTARIAALAHATDLLSGGAQIGPTVRGVVEQAVMPHCVDDERFVIDGPHLPLPPRKAHTLSLAIHELATNAVKHGAWSTGTGEVNVTWSETGERPGQRLHLEWRERGGPSVSPPTRRGFGSRLIERGLAGEFGAAVKLLFEPGGLVCVVDAPLAA